MPTVRPRFDGVRTPPRPPARLTTGGRWLAGAGAAALLAGGVAGLALGEGLLPLPLVVVPDSPAWAEFAIRAGVLLGGMVALVAAGRYGYAALSGRRPGPWRRWFGAASESVPTAAGPPD